MIYLNNILGVILRWGLVNIAAVLIIILFKPTPMEIVILMILASLTATCLVIQHIWKHQNARIKKVELDFLHAQINPHFLFNTLNTIVSYTRTNPETARRLLIRLASFFRHALKRHGHFNSLKEEIEYINTYLVLEKARFREKLVIQRDIDPELLNYRVPALTLQPIVENAIKHGIQPKIGAGTVHIKVKASGDEMLFVISDDGVGMNKDDLKNIMLPGFGSGNGIGLSNVHERLISLFGKNYGLRIESSENKGTTVCFRVPLMISEDVKGGLTGEAKSADCR
ncbi:MAG: Sensor histidine kinase YehU [Pelotomaculum sp. PtaB.Bin013]|nr:MAG: Sensor histidine kinase YehU [Pelotomaculum sp. PtaB.Bin013]